MLAALRCPTVILSSLLSIALALIVSCLTPPLYRGFAEFELLTDPDVDGADPAAAIAAIKEALAREAQDHRSIHVRHLPETSTVRVTVFDTDPKRAAALANALAGTYQSRRSEEERRWRTEKLEAWRMAVHINREKEQAAKGALKQAGINLAAWRQTFGGDSRDDWSRAPELAALAGSQKDLRDRIAKLKGLPLEEFLKQANRYKLIDSAMMKDVSNYYGALATIEAQSRAGLREASPEVRAAKKSARDQRVDLEAKVAAILGRMHLEWEAQQRQDQALRVQMELDWSMLEKARTQNEAASTAYERERVRLHDTRLRYEAERTSAAMIPEFIAIRRSASPQPRPALPGFWQPLLISPLVGLFIGVLLMLVTRWGTPEPGSARAYPLPTRREATARG